jgi:2-amino-4-hydroxy-6-hydroxymethyldihydropteridine diphosphokinase
MGSNIEPRSNMLAALDALFQHVEVLAASRLFATDAVADEPVPAFLNAAVEIGTTLSPARLKFDVLRAIEADLGRVRSEDRNAPRQIDLDIALFGDRVLQDEVTGLRIPDPDILRYAHVARPLADLAPERLHPVDGRSLREIAETLISSGGVCLAPAPDALLVRLAGLRRSH